ncbi:hypothetical protein, partial [Vibrio vulnificus]|uniref:hypothetical protein n=1 Tax=Vibrio vulnificus TaxID=672 RepID=UPI0019D495D6
REEKEFLLDLVEKIKDDETRKEYLEKLKELLCKEERLIKEPQEEIYDLNKIIERFSNKPQIVDIQDLQQEIRQIKDDIVKLKE